ncbi:MAG: peptidoglycan DD-metalloendopeptidase family protein, partial [Pseudomonadota bacterium]
KASLYASIYATSLAQGLTPSQIMRVLRIHAYDTDYRKRLKSGDGLEVFFDLRKTDNGDLEPGELLFTALTSGGDTRRFWRFRSQDGTVDYYNEFGQNARKFLMRKPVRGSNVRLTSGYGMRRHPILNRLRMHSGIDWAAPSGTPILAAGNGVVVEARRRGGNGNFIRLRHANGYQTTYSHLRRFAPGMRPGRRVKQGQLIGFVGTTGLSTGAHLHFEVHVNGRSVDPLKMKVPRERTLRGRELRDFQRERARIMTVLRSPPVRVAGR